MLSLGSRDGRKGLGFGGKMDETELEEGEAILYGDDDDLTVDPDIALAYLDEKLQNVLGHFQKDFEGGVSAENLGAKFGGYGSFLPTYQRSPVCSHTRTPEVENHALKLPSNFQHEGSFRNITAGASASLPAHCSDISNARTLPAEEPVTARYPHKLDAGVEHNQPEELTTSVKISKRFIVPDQKKCRVHIRVCSDNSSIQTKAELYSGLGLLASPSSSFENSSEGEQWSREPHDSPDQSPNSIINIMTSFQLERGRVLLSPLTKALAYLTGTKKSLKGRADSTSRSETRKSLDSASGPAVRNNRKSLVPGNKKYSTVNAMCLSLSNGGTKDVNISKTSEEADDETSPYEMLISKALELPVLSSLDGTDSDMPKSSGKRSELIMGDDKGTISLQLSKAGPSDMVVNHNGVDERSTTEVGSVRNIWEDHTKTVVGDTEVQSTKSLICMGGKICELNPSETLKTVEQEQNMYMSLKSDMKDGNRESEAFGAETDRSSSKAKSKFKATQGHDIAAESVNRKARDRPSSRSKHEKRKSEGSKHGAENRRLHNGVRNSRDTYKDNFRDLNSEREENGLQSPDYSSRFGPKDSQVNYIGKITLKNRLRVEERCKNREKTMLSGSQPKTGSHAAPIVTGAVADSLAPAAPVIIKEHWVCCDNCQKWRLLPVGRLPESLPEKWLCNMLDWLPGMNHCDIEEEETTKALVSFYQASIPESNKSTIGHIGSSTYGALPSGRTKKLQSAVESRSLNDVYHAPAVSNLDNKHLGKTSYLAVEKKRKMSKDEVKVREHSSEEVVLPGVMANVTINKKKRAGQYSPRALKKHKIEDPSTEGPLSQTDHQVASTNVGPYARSISQLLGTSRDYIECTEDIPCRNLIGEEIGKSKTFKNSKDQASHSVDGSFVKRKDVTKDSSAKKRKAKSSQAESGHSESLPSVGLKDEEGKCSLKDSSQKFASKEKKARLSSHLPGSIRENNSERVNLAVPKDFMHTHDPDRILFKGFKEDMEHSRKYLAPAHPIMEATSSSSKKSRSSKSKANLQDTKGSPVESVSSSPLRSRRNARHASNGGRAIGKYCPLSDYGFAVSPKRCSNHESDGTTGSARHVKMDNSRMGDDFDFPHKGTKSSVGNSEGKSVACDELSNRGTLTKVANTYHKHPREVPVAEARKTSHSLLDVSLTDKKGPSIQSKDRMQKSKFGSGKNNPSNVLNGSRDQIQTHGNKLMGDGLGEHIKPQKLEKEYDVKIPSENGREGSQVKSSADGMQDAKHEIIPNLFTSRKIITEDLHGTPNTSSENIILLETIPLPRKSDVRSDYTRYSSHRVNEIENTSVDAYVGYDSLKGLEPVRNENNQKGVEPTVLRHQILTGHSSKGRSSASPARRDSSSQSAASAVKEAKSLKHVADRLKSSGSNTESTGLYFQAALKFLLGASLLESSTSETGHRDIVQSTQMYISTAKLCEFCAREFEKAQDMASAALAYKCTEVAYMRVVFSSHSNANRDRHELQTVLQIAPPVNALGESPSSSASDVDNLNNAATGEKFLARGVCSPQLAGSHVISARSRSIFTRLLNFAQDVSFAMEASRKSRLTLAAADAYLEKVQNDNGINLIRRALDYNFQDVEGLLQLVRLGVEAISR